MDPVTALTRLGGIGSTAEVLTLTDNGRSLRLDVPLLRRQFRLDTTGGART